MKENIERTKTPQEHQEEIKKVYNQVLNKQEKSVYEESNNN